jgi:hypothetical protein
VAPGEKARGTGWVACSHTAQPWVGMFPTKHAESVATFRDGMPRSVVRGIAMDAAIESVPHPGPLPEGEGEKRASGMAERAYFSCDAIRSSASQMTRKPTS